MAQKPVSKFFGHDPPEYGWHHKKLRSQLAPKVAAGVCVCARCGMPIGPNEPWDLGHDDNNRACYVGPEHRRCNRATATRKRRQSRKW